MFYVEFKTWEPHRFLAREWTGSIEPVTVQAVGQFKQLFEAIYVQNGFKGRTGPDSRPVLIVRVSI